MSCADCDGNFQSASELLRHFALHVNSVKAKSVKSLTKNIPDLYPIVTLKNVLNKYSCTNFDVQKINDEDNVDSGFEDLNLTKYFSVVVDDGVHPSLTCTKGVNYSKWDLDCALGEGIFKSQRRTLKNVNYLKHGQGTIRNCQARKHENKYKCNMHKGKRISEKSKMQIPDLKPINIPKKQKSRKQDKMGIKRKVCHMKNNLQKDKF